MGINLLMCSPNHMDFGDGFWCQQEKGSKSKTPKVIVLSSFLASWRGFLVESGAMRTTDVSVERRTVCSLGLQGLWCEEGNSWLLGLLGQQQKREVLIIDKLLLIVEKKPLVHRSKIAGQNIALSNFHSSRSPGEGLRCFGHSAPGVSGAVFPG